MTSDLDLLRQFARENAQDAFAEIVRRHLNLVYSAALRQVRSPQLAEEVAQLVFADLARGAGKISGTGVPLVSSLTPWLYAVTRRTAVDVIRKESRSQLREQIAVEMNTMNATESGAGVPPVWSEIEPFLDEAMHTLDDTDRAAVLLRFFENKSLREVGATLGTSDDAAQKRVSRAVERLREFFSKRNITIGASGLVVLISANAVQAAPVGLTATISAAAVLAGTAVQTSTIIAATKTIAMTTLQKTVITAALAAAVGTGVFEAHQAVQLRGQNQTLQQQQAPLDEQIQKLQRERDDATNRLAGLQAENEQLKPNETELLRLRGEVGVLRRQTAETTTRSPLATAIEVGRSNESVTNLPAKIERLKFALERMPYLKIPELQFVTEQDWSNAASSSDELKTDENYRWAFTELRRFVEDHFGGMTMRALEKYMQANNGQFPTELSQLQPYYKSPMDEEILRRYEIVPSKTLPDSHMDDDWVITTKAPVDRSDSREVIDSRGYGHGSRFYSPQIDQIEPPKQ